MASLLGRSIARRVGRAPGAPATAHAWLVGPGLRGFGPPTSGGSRLDRLYSHGLPSYNPAGHVGASADPDPGRLGPASRRDAGARAAAGAHSGIAPLRCGSSLGHGALDPGGHCGLRGRARRRSGHSVRGHPPGDSDRGYPGGHALEDALRGNRPASPRRHLEAHRQGGGDRRQGAARPGANEGTRPSQPVRHQAQAVISRGSGARRGVRDTARVTDPRGLRILRRGQRGRAAPGRGTHGRPTRGPQRHTQGGQVPVCGLRRVGPLRPPTSEAHEVHRDGVGRGRTAAADPVGAPRPSQHGADAGGSSVWP